MGSAAYSDVSANIAVNALTNIAESSIPKEWNVDSIMAILHTGFVAAQNEIEKEMEKHSRLPEEHDTTLTAVVYNGRKIVYGHVGDGGIIGLGSFGDYFKVTEVQKGEEHNMVVPLRGGPDYWVFDYSEEEFSSILMLTDGLLDIMLPSLLRGDIYINYVRQFMDINKLGLTVDNQEQIKTKIENYLKSDKIDFVTDDKTIVGLINYDLVPEEKESSYYEEPDWSKLKEELKMALYKDSELANKEDAVENEEHDHVITGKDNVEIKPEKSNQPYSEGMREDQGEKEQQKDKNETTEEASEESNKTKILQSKSVKKQEKTIGNTKPKKKSGQGLISRWLKKE